MVFDRGFGRIVAVVFFCVFACPLACFADKVYLKSGEVEEGRIIEKNAEYIILYANGVSKVHRAFEIVKIVEENLPSTISAKNSTGQVTADGQTSNECASTSACCTLGTTALAKGESDRAIKFFDEAIRYAPQNATAYAGRGRAHIIKGEKGEDQKKELSLALVDADAAVRLAPSLAFGWLLRARILVKLGRADEAIIDSEKAMAIDSHSPIPYGKRAEAYFIKGNYDGAISDYSKAIALSNEKANLVLVLSERAGAYVKKGDLVRAEIDCNRAIQIDPSNANAYKFRAKVFAARKEHDQSWAAVRKSQELGGSVDPAFLEELKKNAPSS